MTRLFWRYFFSLLLVFVGVAEWACAAWLLSSLAGVRFGAWTHVAAPLLIYVLNRLIVSLPWRASGAGRAFRRVYTAVAFASIFGFFVLLLVGLVWGVARTGLEIAGAEGPDAERVERLSRAASAVATGGLLAVGATIAYGYGIGQRRLWVNAFDVEVPQLDSRLDGLRLVQLSDVHLGPYMSGDRISGYVARVRALQPDVVVITGDVTDGLDHAPETFAALGRLHAPLGVFVILGNHDFYTGADAVEAALRRWTGFTVLRDATACIERDGARLYVIGLDDRGMDWARGVRHCRELDELYARVPPSAPILLLTHRPDLFGQAAKLGIALTLAGHTHGGQLALPWPGRPATLAHFMTPYPRGTYRRGRSTLHVNLGLGMTGQPIRIASPREITVVTLRRA